MAIPLFGFSPPQPQIRGPSSRRVPNFGDYFLDTFQQQFSEGAARYQQQQMQEDQQEFVSEQDQIDRAFRAQERQAGQSFQRELIGEERDFTVSSQIATGQRIPATEENIERLEHRLGSGALQRSVITDPSSGQSYISPNMWRQVEEQEALDFGVEDPVPSGLVDSLQRTAQQAGLQGFDEGFIEEITTGGEDERISPRQRQAFDRDAATILTMAGLSTERAKLWAQLRSNRNVDEQEYRNAVRNIMENTRVYTDVQGENGEVRQVELTGRDKAMYATNFGKIYFQEGYDSPGNIAYLENFDVREMEDPEAWKANALEVVKRGIGSRDDARTFNLQYAYDVWNRVKEDPEGSKWVLENYFGGGRNPDVIGKEAANLIAQVEGNPSLAKALYLMHQYPNTQAFAEGMERFGGWQNFSAEFHDAIPLMKKLNPQVYAELNTGQLTYLSAPGANRNPLDAPGSERASRPAVDSVATVDNVQQLIDGLEQSVTLRMSYDPAAEREFQEFIVAVQDDSTATSVLMKEFDDVLRLAEQGGIIGPAEREAFAERKEELRLYIEDNRDVVLSEFVPRLQDALARARENNSR